MTGGNLHKKHLLWLIPLGLLLVAVMGVLALPKFVASSYHRATIEGMASSLTGRSVHIRGKLSLALLPHPQFIAGDVTITSPDKETITAASLTLDIAPIPLLRGQILARSITLQSPHIALPWPLPGGAAAIAPARWLTALHAQITNGVISLGSATFNHVSADIFTGGDGAFTASGSAILSGYPLNLSLSFGAVSAVGSTALTMDVQGKGAAKPFLHLTGTYDSSSTLSGKLTFGAASLGDLDSSLAKPLTGSADITADPDQIALSNLSLRQAAAILSGSARLVLSHHLLTLLLAGQNLTLPLNAGTFGAADRAFSLIPTHLALDAADTEITTPAIAGGAIFCPHLHGIFDFSTAGTNIAALDAGLSGNTSLSLSGTLDPAGNLLAKAIFSSTDLPEFFSAYGAHPVLPAAWAEASLSGKIHGTADQMSFDNLAGNFGPARITGTAILAQQHSLTGALHFDQLDLTPFVAMLRNPPDDLANPLDADFEISADRASIGSIPLQHLLIDAALTDRLVVRRFTASLFGGIAAASFTLAPGQNHSPGLITSAQAILALPSAQNVVALLPWQFLPPSFAKDPLALSLLAAGPASALATSASFTLGPVSITAAPSIDLVHQVAAGAFTLRHPNAIAAFKAFGLNAGLAWPGAGSIALRANMLLTPTQMGFSDFVLSMGDLTSNGRLIYGTDHQLTGQIDADTLALPPIPANLTLNWANLGLQGKIALSANRVLYAGAEILGSTATELDLNPAQLNLTVAHADLAGGVLKGAITSTGDTSGKAALPAITGKFTLTGADASEFDLPLDFPLTLATGGLDMAADLTATGYAPQAWLATISGSASLAAHAGSLNGFDLPGMNAALLARLHRQALLHAATMAGTTPFTRIGMTGNFSNGIYTIAAATLQSPAGSAAATGTIDLPDAGTTLNLDLTPAVPAPPQIGLTLAGTWTTPHRITALKTALTWKPPTPN